MQVFSHFDLEKELLLSYHFIKLSSDVEVWYVNLVKAIDVPFEGCDFSASSHPLTALKI